MRALEPGIPVQVTPDGKTMGFFNGSWEEVYIPETHANGGSPSATATADAEAVSEVTIHNHSTAGNGKTERAVPSGNDTPTMEIRNKFDIPWSKLLFAIAPFWGILGALIAIAVILNGQEAPTETSAVTASDEQVERAVNNYFGANPVVGQPGQQGPAGVKGDRGEQGPVGPQGLAGVAPTAEEVRDAVFDDPRFGEGLRNVIVAGQPGAQGPEGKAGFDFSKCPQDRTPSSGMASATILYCNDQIIYWFATGKMISVQEAADRGHLSFHGPGWNEIRAKLKEHGIRIPTNK